METIGAPALWAGFHRRAHEVSLKEAAAWSALWVALAAAFNLGVYAWFGAERALEFTTGYLVEKAPAIDNIFVFVVISATFAVPTMYQHRVLFWGVIGALVMRAVFIPRSSSPVPHGSGSLHWIEHMATWQRTLMP